MKKITITRRQRMILGGNIRMPLLVLMSALVDISGGVALPIRSSGSVPVDSTARVGDVRSYVRTEVPQHENAIGGSSHMRVQMLESGAMRVAHDKSPSHLYKAWSDYVEAHPSAEPPPALSSKRGPVVEPPLELLPTSWKQKQKLNRFKDVSQVHDHDAREPNTNNGDDVSNREDDDEDASDGFQGRDDERRARARGYVRRQNHDSLGKSDDDDWDDVDSQTAVVSNHRARVHRKAHAASSSSISGDGSEEGNDDDTGSYNNVDVPVVNVTAEEDASALASQSPLKAINPNQPTAPPLESDVEKLGEGIGAMAYERSPTGSRSINYEIRKRLQLQDLATITLLMAVFGLTVLLSCFSVYQIADDPSPAAYYSEPKNAHQRVICETNGVDAFLAAFNTQPQNVRLRIIGRNPEPGGFRRFLRNVHPHSMRPRGLAALLPVRQRRRLPVLFDVALDLTPFITGEGRLVDDNLSVLQSYLTTKNKLETLVIQKRVDWVVWEDVATNVRQRLRTLGFPGDVEVRFEAYDEILVYQNHKWSNFVRNRVTQALVVISVVGSFFWLPYVWARSKTTKLETKFRINVDPARYWELVSDGLSAAQGFQST